MYTQAGVYQTEYFWEETQIQPERGRFSVEEIPGVLGNKACIASYQ
jgi:hypothetical protein